MRVLDHWPGKTLVTGRLYEAHLVKPSKSSSARNLLCPSRLRQNRLLAATLTSKSSNRTLDRRTGSEHQNIVHARNDQGEDSNLDLRMGNRVVANHHTRRSSERKVTLSRPLSRNEGPGRPLGLSSVQPPADTRACKRCVLIR